MTEEEMHSMFGNADPFSDFFKTFFGIQATVTQRTVEWLPSQPTA